MYVYEVGQIIEEFRGRPEGVRFDMADDGATLLIFFSGPSKGEIESIGKGKVQLGMFVKEDIIFILSKFENLPWMDAPYHVALSQNLTELQEIEEGQGYGCHIVLIDSTIGRIETMRLVGLSTEFSKKLKENIGKQMCEDFGRLVYAEKLNRIFCAYTTKDMVACSEVKCKIGGSSDGE